MDLQDSQLESVTEMLKLPADDDDDDSVATAAVGTGSVERKNRRTWKILVYDNEAKMILAPILKVGELRRLGVTINMSVSDPREPIPGVDVIYFVEPNEANISVILNDAKSKKYNQVHINFTTCTSDDYLSNLAKTFVEHGAVGSIASVVDRYLHFIALSPYTFSLNLPDGFFAFYGDATEEECGSRILEQLVERLICVIVTLNCLPIIRAPRSMSPANTIAERLNTRLHELANARHQLGISLANSFNRPMLVILDRNVDLGAMIQHSWNYQPLLHDVFGIFNNKVIVEQKDQKTTFELDANDKTYQYIQKLPLNDVAMHIASSLETYNVQISQINKGDVANPGTLVSAMNAIPQLTEQKRLLDMHTNMATALVDAVKDRDLDQCVEYECDLPYASDKNATNHFEDILASKATVMDKYRCLLLMALTKTHWPDSKFDEYETRIKHHGKVDFEALKGLRSLVKMRAFSENLLKHVEKATTRDFTTAKSIIEPNGPIGGSGSAAADGYASSSSSAAVKPEVSERHKRLANYSSKIIDTGVNIFKGVRNLLPRKKEPYIVTLIENLLNNAANVDDEFTTYDPKISATSLPKSIKKASNAKDCIVFMVGGGSYIEAGAIQDLGTRLKHTMIYGSTYFDRPQDFTRKLGSIQYTI